MPRTLKRAIAVLGAAMLAGTVAAASPGPAAWTLHALDGKAVGPRDLAPRWALFYLGYTYCADICPASLVDMDEILEGLGDDARRVQPVFVSIDPERDTPELLRRYLENFSAPILALRGSEEEIRALAASLRFHYVRYRDPSLAGDSFDHTSSFFLLDPEGRVAADFATELPPTEIAAAIAEHLSREGEPK
jgi:protein SCO1/2